MVNYKTATLAISLGSQIVPQNIYLSADIAAAFDSIDRNYILDIIKRMKFPTKFQGRLSKILTNNQVDNNLNRKNLKRVPHENGLGQGDPMSSSLFNIEILPLILALKNRGNGYKMIQIRQATGPNIKAMNNEEVGQVINYADDNNSVLTNISQAPEILKIYDKFEKPSNLKINI